MQQIGQAISNGDIDAVPLMVDDHSKCDYCDYKSVCRIDFENVYKEAIKFGGYDAKNEAINKMKVEAEVSDNG